MGNTTYQQIASSLLLLILFGIAMFSIYVTFNVFSFVLAIVLTLLVIITNKKILENLLAAPMLIYYSIFLTFTLFLSVDECKGSKDLMLLLIANVLICVSLFLSNDLYICYFFIFVNFYVILRILMFFLLGETSELMNFCSKK